LDDLKVNSRQGFYKARFELDVPPSPTCLTKEHCRANREQIKNILRRHRGEQIRIEFRTANGGTISAIYTVKTFHNDRNLISLGDKIQNQLSNCQLSNSNTCEGEVKSSAHDRWS